MWALTNRWKELSVTFLEMTRPKGFRDGSSQSPRDHILWILTNSGGRMDRSRLRRCAGIKLADVNLILGELAREGRIRITGEVVSLI